MFTLDVLSVSPSKEPQIAPKDAKEKAKQLLASGVSVFSLSLE